MSDPPRRRRWLRWVLIGAALAVLWASPFAWRYYQERQFLADVKRAGGSVIRVPDLSVLRQWLSNEPVYANVYLDACDVDDAWLAKHRDALARLPLVTLGVSETPVSDEGIEQLVGLSNLVGLGLQGSKISDAALEHLARLPNLQTLDLRSTSVTDAGIAHLKRCATLRLLYLDGTGITADGVASLQQALPGCKIVQRTATGR